MVGKNWAQELNWIVETSRHNLKLTLLIIGLPWVIHTLNVMTKKRLNILGIWPRHVMGLPGIICAPFLHASYSHLMFNSIPLLVLIDLILLYQLPVFLLTTAGIMLIGGSLTWLFGRRAIHIGASGLVLGYWGFLLVTVYYNPGVLGLFVGALCLYYLGGLFFNLFPSGKGTSWEGHLFGFIGGITTAYLIRQPEAQAWVRPTLQFLKQNLYP